MRFTAKEIKELSEKSSIRLENEAVDFVFECVAKAADSGCFDAVFHVPCQYKKRVEKELVDNGFRVVGSHDSSVGKTKFIVSWN